MQVTLLITVLLLCSYTVLLPAVIAQFPALPKVPLIEFDSNSSWSMLADNFVEPQDPGSGGGGEGVI